MNKKLQAVALRSVYSDSLDLMVIFCVEQISKHMLAVGTTRYFRVFDKFSLENGITISVSSVVEI